MCNRARGRKKVCVTERDKRKDTYLWKMINRNIGTFRHKQGEKDRQTESACDRVKKCARERNEMDRKVFDRERKKMCVTESEKENNVYMGDDRQKCRYIYR